MLMPFIYIKTKLDPNLNLVGPRENVDNIYHQTHCDLVFKKNKAILNIESFRWIEKEGNYNYSGVLLKLSCNQQTLEQPVT